MKRLFALMLALAMVLSLGVTAFADGGATAGSITITNATKDQSYAVYKIFDATYNAYGDVTYTIDAGDQFFDEMFGTDGTTPNAYFTYHASTGVVTKNDGVDNPDLFKYLDELVERSTPDASGTANSSSITFDNLPTGYYVIKRTTGTANAVTIHTAKPDANVIDKNQLPGGDLEKAFVGEDADEVGKVWVGSADVGDPINWSVTFTATNYDGEDKVLYYTIKDTLTPAGWAAINTGSIKVFVNGAEISAWELVSGDANGFEIKIPWVNDDADQTSKYAATANVKVTYSATVLDFAAVNNPTDRDNKNNVELGWNGVPKYEDETETKVYNMGFTKVDGTDETKTLSGATFALYRDEACATDPIYVKATSTKGVYILDKDRDTTDSNLVVTPTSGKVVIMGLEEGTYYLKETVPPAGYNLLGAPVSVIVGGTDSDSMEIGGTTYVVNNAELAITNNSGVELPSTGGEGAMMLITIGSVVAMAFAVLLITHKKMSIYHD